MKGDLPIAVSGDAVEIFETRKSGIDAELLDRFLQQKVPCALDVLRRERPAVMPLHPLAQRKGQFGSVLAPGPASCQVRDD